MSSAERVRVRGLSIYRPVIYGNTAVLLTPEERASSSNPDHTHRWTVALRSATADPESGIVGGADDLHHFIKRVTFKLHDTYPNPTRHFDKPPYEVTETGWGEFEIPIKVLCVQDSGEKPITTYHHLKLHPWTLDPTASNHIPPAEEAAKAGPVHSWQYDEIVFHDPFQTFLATLQAHPPTPLPKSKRPGRALPFHSSFASQGSLEASKGSVPEFSESMTEEEKERFEKGRKTFIEQDDRWRIKLIEREKGAFATEEAG